MFSTDCLCFRKRGFMSKKQDVCQRPICRTASIEKAVRYLLSYMKVFFLLNVFLLLIFGSYEPDLFFSPRSVLQAQIIQLYMVSVLVLSALLNGLLYPWEDWTDYGDSEDGDSLD